MIPYTIKQLFEIGIISKRLKLVLSLLNCATYNDLVDLSNDQIKVDYIERSHHLKDELYKTIADIQEMENILPELVETAKSNKVEKETSANEHKVEKFRVGDFTEDLLKKSKDPISLNLLLEEIKKHLPGTYLASIRANLNGDPDKRFVFFLDGYVGLNGKKYDKRYQLSNISSRKVQYAEQRIMEFMSFIEEKHRSPQPRGLEEEESLYRWYLDFTKSNAKELVSLRATFKDYLKEYEDWIFTPYEYSYKRNCDQIKWYVEENLELPTPEDEPELFSWFNSQLENHTKHKDKRKQMFVDLMDYLADYGIRFYDAKSAQGKEAAQINANREAERETKKHALDKYLHLFDINNHRAKRDDFVAQKALLMISIGNLAQNGILTTNEVELNDNLLTEFADVCIDVVGTASSYNIAIPFYYMCEEPFWDLVPKDSNTIPEGEANIITFDFIERTIAYAIIDQELFDVMLNEHEFNIFKGYLIDKVINNKG